MGTRTVNVRVGMVAAALPRWMVVLLAPPTALLCWIGQDREQRTEDEAGREGQRDEEKNAQNSTKSKGIAPKHCTGDLHGVGKLSQKSHVSIQIQTAGISDHVQERANCGDLTRQYLGSRDVVVASSPSTEVASPGHGKGHGLASLAGEPARPRPAA